MSSMQSERGYVVPDTEPNTTLLSGFGNEDAPNTAATIFRQGTAIHPFVYISSAIAPSSPGITQPGLLLPDMVGHYNSFQCTFSDQLCAVPTFWLKTYNAQCALHTLLGLDRELLRLQPPFRYMLVGRWSCMPGLFLTVSQCFRGMYAFALGGVASIPSLYIYPVGVVA
ncbi:hypothetical protein EXIGLDRAFT_837125, partial [Exidia glandulosa HHB12029]